MPRRFSDRLTVTWRLSFEKRLRKYAESSRYSCFHYLYPENTLFEGWRWKGQKKLVLTCHQSAQDLTKLVTDRFMEGMRSADVVVTLAQSEIERLKELAPQARVVFIPHGVDTTYFRPAPLPPERPLVLTVGNWLRDFDCWAQVVRRTLEIDNAVEFLVVALPETLEKARRGLGRESSRVRYESGLSDDELRMAYERTTLVFLPLKSAVANNAVLESMAMGLPVVATDLDATRSYLGAESAVFINNRDPEEGAAAILNLLGSPARRQRMSVAARARAESVFAWEVIARQYRQMYETLSSG